MQRVYREQHAGLTGAVPGTSPTVGRPTTPLVRALAATTRNLSRVNIHGYQVVVEIA